MTHSRDISRSIIEKIIEKPVRLFDLESTLKTIDINFLSPIYIGMASNLRDRLKIHAKQITDFHDSVDLSAMQNEEENNQSFEKYKFAKDAIINRKIHPDRLYFTFKTLPFDNKIENDLENILNRLNYPLCGRN